jgi:hypothetical protein
VQVLSGKIECTGNLHEVYTKIPHEKTLITWTLNIQKPSTTMLKAQLYFYNSITKNKQSSKIIPQEGLYLHHDGQQCVSEMRFVVEQSDKYDNVLLQLEGKYEGTYIVALEKVVTA